MHASPKLYRALHSTHHSAPSSPWTAMLNSAGEMTFTGFFLGVAFVGLRIPWACFVAVNTLAMIKTTWDHSLHSTTHAMHHTRPSVNFEQPFAHVWDIVCGTYAKEPKTSACGVGGGG